jgi:hypothetical protein
MDTDAMELARYRKGAERCREAAETARDADTRQELVVLAEGYEELAKQVEAARR